MSDLASEAHADLPFVWAPEGVNADGWHVGFRSSTRAHGSRVRNGLQTPFLFRDLFSSDECAAITRAGVGGVQWKGAYSGSETEYRRCTTSWIPETESHRWIFDRLREIVLSANDRYGFALVGFGEPLHFVRYPAGGGFGWHTDLGDGAASTRKMSISVQLSAQDEYDGGMLEFCPHGIAEHFSQQGSALVFPSYIPHRIHDISRGERRALVAWLHGDAFA